MEERPQGRHKGFVVFLEFSPVRFKGLHSMFALIIKTPSHAHKLDDELYLIRTLLDDPIASEWMSLSIFHSIKEGTVTRCNMGDLE